MGFEKIIKIFAVITVGFMVYILTLSIAHEIYKENACEDAGYDSYKYTRLEPYCIKEGVAHPVLMDCGFSKCELYEVGE